MVTGGLLAACDDAAGIDWSYFEPDTVLLYSLSSADYFGMAEPSGRRGA